MNQAKKLSEINEKYNIWLKLLAVVISVLIWLVVVNVSDPVTSTTFSGVPVEFVNTEELTEIGKVYELLSDSTVTVTVNAKRSILDSLNKDYLKAVADLRDLDEETGEIKLKVESNKYSEKIESMKTKEEYAVVSVDNLLRKQLSIVANVSGTPADNYIVGNVKMDQNIIRISGPEQRVAKVSKAVADISVDGMSNDISTTADLKLYDESGNLISDKGITQNITSVAIDAEILATKLVGIRAYTSGEPEVGYGQTGEISITPDKIMIAGKASKLKNITELAISSSDVDITDASSDVSAVVDLSKYLPEYVQFADADVDTMANVVVGIAQKEREEIVVNKASIAIQNVPEGYTAAIYMESPYRMELTGMSASMEMLETTPMETYIDISAFMKSKGIAELATASYEIPLKFKLPSGVEVVDAEDYTVTVRVVKEEENKN